MTKATQNKAERIDEPLGLWVLRARGQETLWEDWLAEREVLASPVVPEDFWGDPFLLKGMAEAVDLLAPLIVERRPILIHGDYDCDGLTATALLYRYLLRCGVPADYYIPDRMNEGYGLSAGGVAYAREQKPAALITVDCGVQSFAEVRELEAAGIPVVVSDHHSCLEELPEARAVINPNRRDESGLYSMLAGAGVALKLTQALDRRLGAQGGDWQQGLQFAALGTVADLMLLLGENRRIVLAGLRQLRETPAAGFAALLELLRVTPEKLSAKTLGYSIGPRINACGRMGSVEPAIRLLCSDDAAVAQQAAQELDEINRQRREIEAEIFRQALKCLQNDPQRLGSRILLAEGEGWHLGVLGIVAARLSERLKRPAIVLSKDEVEGNYKGSARSYGQANILNVLHEASACLEKFGGHEKAAGLELRPEQLASFRRALAQAAEQVSPAELEDAEDCAMEIPSTALNLEQAESLALLEPFGRGNPEPLFYFDRLCARESRAIGQDGSHLRLQLQDCGATDEAPVTALAFSQGAKAASLIPGERLCLSAQLQVNSFRGQKSAQLVVRELASCSETPEQPSAALEQLYRSFPDWTAAQLAAPFSLPPAALLPAPEALREVYLRLLKIGLDEGPLLLDAAQTAELCPAVLPQEASLRLFTARRCLEIYEQAGLLNVLPWNDAATSGATVFCYNLQTPADKVNLYDTPCYKRLSV